MQGTAQIVEMQLRCDGPMTHNPGIPHHVGPVVQKLREEMLGGCGCVGRVYMWVCVVMCVGVGGDLCRFRWVYTCRRHNVFGGCMCEGDI